MQKTGKKETIVLKTRTKGAKGLRKPAKAIVETQMLTQRVKLSSPNIEDQVSSFF